MRVLNLDVDPVLRLSRLLLVIAAVPVGCASRAAVRQQEGQPTDRAAQLEELAEVVPTAPQTAPQDDFGGSARDQDRALSQRPSEPAPEGAAAAKAAAKAGDPREAVYIIDELLFAPGSAALTAESRSILDQLAERLRLESSDYHLEVEGHTDGTGSERANLQLGRERAEAVRRYLHDSGGIPLHSITTESLANRSSASGERTQAGRAKNRRVTVTVLRKTARY